MLLAMEETKRKPRWPTYLVVALVLVFVLLFVAYPLSIGPVMAICSYDSPLFWRAWRFYRPIVTVARSTDNLDILNWYLGVWGDTI